MQWDARAKIRKIKTRCGQAKGKKRISIRFITVYGFCVTWNQLISQTNLCLAGENYKLNFADTICGMPYQMTMGYYYFVMDLLQVRFFSFLKRFQTFYRQMLCKFCTQKIWMNKQKISLNALHTDFPQSLGHSAFLCSAAFLKWKYYGFSVSWSCGSIESCGSILSLRTVRDVSASSTFT